MLYRYKIEFDKSALQTMKIEQQGVMCQQLSAPLPTTGNSISFLVVPLRIQVTESITVVLYLVLLHHMVIILESSST